MEKKIIIMGGGPGGYVAAIRAAQLGAKVTLIEKEALGGTCLNKGCIPTKALYRNAELVNNLKASEDFGILVDNFTLEVNKIQERKNGIVHQLVSGVEQLMKANNIEVRKGHGVLYSCEENIKKVKITLDDGREEIVEGDNIIIATGSHTFIPPIQGVNNEGVITSDDIINFKEIPKSLVIIGGGVIGMEFGAIFNSFGTKVTIVEALPSILNMVDGEIVKRLNPMLRKKDIEVHTGAMVKSIEKHEDKLLVNVEGKKGEFTLEGEKVLIATGRKPNIQGLNLEEVNIEYDKKGIKTEDNYETSVKGIYAIGDVNGKWMLAHAASHQGVEVAERIMGIDNQGSTLIPNCIFIFPEIASLGATEEQLKAEGINYKTSKFLFGANGKALALGEGEGLIKVISDEDNKIIGVHILGPHASDLIHEGVVIMNKEVKVEDIKHMVHAHPTLSEAFYEAVLALNNEAIHAVPSRRK
ncbi:dihydrolipoamide dehydrogenase [Clostridium amylolyticum]|uniref:Dihydrolipoyl dehydrogenase n=1 Tax=Clostridium amylolyticum TaxID=1121298 RepID=A0A1M6INL2_9CLOT|nr:dihydrolipoyl dehydrogenase [Clostridium amylolyticum]SHJ36064.1 dihydrolipoamide dehydrogenase [Clostridium amylolyticum]